MLLQNLSVRWQPQRRDDCLVCMVSLEKDERRVNWAGDASWHGVFAQGKNGVFLEYYGPLRGTLVATPGQGGVLGREWGVFPTLKWRCCRIDGRFPHHYPVHIGINSLFSTFCGGKVAGRSDMNMLTAIGILLLLFAIRFLLPMGVVLLIGRLTRNSTQLS